MLSPRVGPPFWDDRPLAVVGCGPSLAGFHHGRLRGPWRVLAVASALWQMPWADAAYDQDSVWLQVNAGRLPGSAAELFLCWPPSQSARNRPLIPGATWLEGQRGDGTFPGDPSRVELGFTSGQGALSVAWHKRASAIVLFGFDYREEGAQQHARNEDYPWHLPAGSLDGQWPLWAKKFNRTRVQFAARGVRVLNASPESAVTAFPRCSIDVGLALLRTWSGAPAWDGAAA